MFKVTVAYKNHGCELDKKIGTLLAKRPTKIGFWTNNVRALQFDFLSEKAAKDTRKRLKSLPEDCDFAVRIVEIL